MNETLSPFKLDYPEAQNDDYINKLTSQGVDVLLVLDPNIPATLGKVNYEDEGYKLASYAAKRYQGKVKYYQIANEVSGTVVKKDGDKGPFFKDDLGMEYDSNKYKVTLGWIKGMSRGIRENDSSAKILLSGHWILYGVFNNLVRDGADFDIIGWAYYSSDGDDPTKREYNYGNYMNLAEKLSQFKRDLWIVEANRAGGSYDKNAKTSSPSAEEEQANYLESLLKNVYNSGYFKGFIVFTLFDSPTAEELGYPQDAYLGLAEVKKTGSDNRIQKYKRAFYVFRDFINSHPKIPTI